jgi:hypothetical protein
MSTLAESFGEIRKPWQWFAVGGAILLVWGALAFPRIDRGGARLEAAPEKARTKQTPDFYAQIKPKAQAISDRQTDAVTSVAEGAIPTSLEAGASRKIIRTSSIGMVVQNPADAAEKITALAEGMGGYLVSAEGGGQDAAAGILTIRVPATRFEEARAAIHKLGLHVESEKIDAQDVSRQYVDQDANLRNLRSEEAGYLSILKQAHTVKDMLAVSEKLSEVRGKIEEREAEFNQLSRQIETVALTVSLRTEVEPQAFGLNWRPAYQLKLALRDGLESLANYATAMTTILFYLPAVLLWVGTIVMGTVIGWKVVRWGGRRWFGWSVTPTSAQG